jgi:uncharacterized membrane protein YraQ (UPF0718 family)
MWIASGLFAGQSRHVRRRLMISPDQTATVMASWAYFLHLTVTLVPLFLAASFLVGLADAYLPAERVEAILRGHDEGLGNVAAAGLGAVTPFCSCSTIPMLAGLLQAGAPLGLAFSFLLASPLVNEIAILLLIGIFGLEVTLLYVVFTFTAAVLGGLIVGRLPLADHVKDVARRASDTQPVATDGGEEPTVSRASHRSRVGDAAREAVSFLRDMGPYLLVGMVAGALIHGVVPVDLLHAVFGPENPIAIPIAAVVGAPLYVSLSGMLPIAETLSSRGIAIGTVLAFVIGGAGVSLPNLVLLHSLFDRRLLAVYVASILSIAILVGTVFNGVLV